MEPLTSNVEFEVKNLSGLFSVMTQGSVLNLTSDTFGIDNFKFMLVLVLEKNNEDLVSIFIRQFDANYFANKVNTKYSVYVKKDGQRLQDLFKSTHEYEDKQALGLRRIPTSTLTSLNDFFLCCEIETNSYTPARNLQNTYLAMLANGTCADCVIKVSGEEIKAHRCILSNTDVFRAMFTAEMLEGINCELTITDSSPAAVRALLKYIYSGVIDKADMESHVLDIFAIADRYLVESLKFECENVMASKISAENIVTYAAILDKCTAPTLENVVVNYIKEKKETFFESVQWKNIEKTYPSVGCRISKKLYLMTFNL